MKNKKLLKFSLSIIVILMCILLSNNSPFFQISLKDRVSNITQSDINVTIINETELEIENLIKSNDLQYSWVVTNKIRGKNISGSDFLPTKENRVISFSYEDLSTITFKPVVKYNNTTYTGQTFIINEDGSFYQDLESEKTAPVYQSNGTRSVTQYVSIMYLLFLIIVATIFYIAPKKYKSIVLLFASLYFYYLSGIQYLVIVLFTAICTYFITNCMNKNNQKTNLLIEQSETPKEKRILKKESKDKNRQTLFIGIIASLGPMLIIKYADFSLTNINALAKTNIPMLNLIMPLGLSFYTFMIIGYIIDIYNNKYASEQNFGKFLLFMIFFPHVAQGPISRFDEFSTQLKNAVSFNYKNICFGAQRILWGFFIKLVLADRLAIIVNFVFDDVKNSSYMMLIIASLLYSIQIYADFYSSMEIAIGSAEVFGIKLPNNFLRPYFATTMPEFWRRWHVTLGTWFKDYVFFPISMSKSVMKLSFNSRKKFGPEISKIVSAIPPILGVWILTGLWHGSAWKFVAWGLFHGFLILLSTSFSDKYQAFLTKIGIKNTSWDYKLFQMIKVFVLCSIGRIFFRATSLSQAIIIFKAILTKQEGLLLFDFSVLSTIDINMLILSIFALLIVSITQEKVGSMREQISKANVWIRYIIWIVLLLVTLYFGIYGSGTSSVFIYENF